MVLDLTHAQFTPFSPAVDKRLKAAEMEVVKVFDHKINSTLAAAATVVLGYLPTDAIITQGWVQVVTPLTSASDNTIAIHCESAADVLAATDLTDDSPDAIVAGVSTGTAANMKFADGGCAVTATVGAGDTGISAGQYRLFLRYAQGL